MQVRSRDCAFLNPYPGKPNKAGMVLYEGEALPHGLLAWQSERDGHDSRLHFAAWPAGAALPEAKEPKGTWARLLGTPGRLSPRPDLPTTLKVFDAKAWDLERLAVPMREPPGADLPRIGISPRKKP